MTEKNLFLILMIMLFIPLVSCGTSEQDEEKEMKEETSVETEEMENEIESEDSDENDMKKEEKTENQEDEENEEEIAEPDEELVAMGKDVYKNKGCVACHTIGKGKLVGPDLLGVTERRSEDWLSRWMLNPDEMLKTDPIAKEMLKVHMVPMPNQGLTEKEVEALIAYMKHEDMKN